MPEKDGLQLIEEIKMRFSNVKIIAISEGVKKNNIDSTHIAKYMGADYTLAKPFSMKQFIEAVRNVI